MCRPHDKRRFATKLSAQMHDPQADPAAGPDTSLQSFIEAQAGRILRGVMLLEAAGAEQLAVQHLLQTVQMALKVHAQPGRKPLPLALSRPEGRCAANVQQLLKACLGVSKQSLACFCYCIVAPAIVDTLPQC